MKPRDFSIQCRRNRLTRRTGRRIVCRLNCSISAVGVGRTLHNSEALPLQPPPRPPPCHSTPRPLRYCRTTFPRSICIFCKQPFQSRQNGGRVMMWFILVNLTCLQADRSFGFPQVCPERLCTCMIQNSLKRSPRCQFLHTWLTHLCHFRLVSYGSRSAQATFHAIRGDLSLTPFA